MFSETNLHACINNFHNFFTHEVADEIAVVTGFIKRQTGKIKPLNFLALMVVELMQNSLMSLNTMTNHLCSMELACRVTPQALWERLASKEAPAFLRRCLGIALSEKLKVDELVNMGILSNFNNVYLEDSTHCNLNENATELYRGVGGSSSKSAYKAHLTWNLSTSDIKSLRLTDASVTDQSTAENILTYLEEGDLIIRDLGYFDMKVFEKFNNKGAYFLSRLKQNVVVYDLNGDRIKDICGYVEDKLGKDCALGEIEVLIGRDAKIPVRLVFNRVPDDVYNQRMRKARDVARKKGYTITKEKKRWNRYTFFITNAPKKKLPTSKVCVTYNIRWQIELIFKSWKSLLDIDVIRCRNINYISCLILSRFLAIILISRLYSWVSTIVYKLKRRNLSLPKFITWLKDNAEIFTNPSETHSLIKKLEYEIFGLCTQLRTRKTTKEELENGVTFFDLYVECNEQHELIA